MAKKRKIRWNRNRVFGVELEFNADSVDRARLKRAVERAGQDCDVRDWERSRDNHGLWIAKTDSSCGYELCSPPSQGPKFLKTVGDVVSEVFSEGATFNNQCGLHVHVGLSDFTDEQLYSLLAHWIKIEMVVMHAHPDHRRQNEYCMTCNSRIGNLMSDQEYSGREIYNMLRDERKQTLNLYYWGERKSIEFRMGEMSDDPLDVKNRIRFLIWFVDICKIMPMPKKLNWFSPKETMRFLNLCYDTTDTVQKQFSPAVTQMRNWILERLNTHLPSDQRHEDDRKLVAEMIEEFKMRDEKEINVEALV